MSKPKILIYDIETSPLISLTWGRYDQNVVKVVRDREIMSFAYKWAGESKIRVLNREEAFNSPLSEKSILKTIAKLLNEADASVAHNGDSFDKKVIRARMIKHNLRPLKHLVTVDTLSSARRYFSFTGNSLKDLSEFFGFGKKGKTDGIDLWWGCMNGDEKSWRDMTAYNAKDVELLEKIYLKLKPWIESHPNLSVLDGKAGVCPSCESRDVQKNGVRPQLRGVQQRWACKGCGKAFLTPFKKGIKV